MRLILLAAGVLVLVIPGARFLGENDRPADETPPQPVVTESKAEGELEQSSRVQPAAANRPFELDPDRLYDRGYENDSGLQALAEEHGIPPACLIALAKYALHQVPVDLHICPRRSDAINLPTLAVGEDHPYNEYSDAELRSLATSSAEAAVVLARRLESNTEAQQLYERAVALSGIGEPLIEWMTLRDVGGLTYENDVLDVEHAKAGYKLALIAVAFEGVLESTLELYREELLKAGADPDVIEEEAEGEVARLRELRQELTGGDRP